MWEVNDSLADLKPLKGRANPTGDSTSVVIAEASRTLRGNAQLRWVWQLLSIQVIDNNCWGEGWAIFIWYIINISRKVLRTLR